MSNIKSIFDKNSVEIIRRLNDKFIERSHIVGMWKDENDLELTLTQFRDRYWEGKTKTEFAVDLGVSMGKITEFYLPKILSSLNANVTPKFTSSGDMKELYKKHNHTSIEFKEYKENVEKEVLEIYWEIKTGRGDAIQGATHSPKEKGNLNLIQILWDTDWDAKLKDVLESNQFIDKVNLSVFFDTDAHTSTGKHSDTNSRTTIKFKSDRYDDCVNACVYGTLKKNPTNVKFIKEGIVYGN
tara:strand:+ start:98 stop:820 length:723 start_codon:yes stop_codon:yes gene_type:complete